MYPRVTLPGSLSAAYRDRQHQRLITTLRVSLVAGSLLGLYFIPWSRMHDTTNQLPTIELGLALTAGLLIFLLLTLFNPSRTRVEVVALTACLFAMTMASVLLTTLPNGFHYGVGTLLGYVVVSTALSIDLSLGTTLVIATGYLAIPNIALFVNDASPLLFMNTNWLLLSGGVVAIGLAYILDQSHRRSFLLEQQLADEKARGDALLSTLLPTGIAEKLRESDEIIAEVEPAATVLFADIVGFTRLSQSVSPEELIDLLTRVFTTFDELAIEHGLEKIKTIGDSYMVAAGVADAKAASVKDVANFGLDAIDAVRQCWTPTGDRLDVRIGMATGPVVCGVIGRRKPHFDLWGSTVNLAARLEASSPTGCLHVDEATAGRLASSFTFKARGTVDLPGIGSVATCVLTGQSIRQKDAVVTPGPPEPNNDALVSRQSVSIGNSGSRPHSVIDPS